MRHPAADPTPAGGTTYRIKIKGVVDDRWSSWFDGMQITHDDRGDTTLAGTVRDQTELHGLLAKVRDLGLTLLAVEPRAGSMDARVAAATRPFDRGVAGPGAGRSPVPAILASIAAGLTLAIALIVGPTAGAPEPVVTGSTLIAFGLGWGLLAWTSGRTSTQPQRWTVVPALAFVLVGLALIVTQPSPDALTVLGWVWPPALAVLAIWMAVQARTHLRGRGRWLVGSLIVTILLMSVGGAVATLTAASGSATPPPAGRLIDIGGRRLYLECHGEGGPVVVLQSGLGGSAADWALIAPTVASSTTVCAYDRAGHGWSDPAPAPQDGTALASDLHILLERAGVPGPYVLVGHSSGGPYVRVFAARYPAAAAGMVLLDAQPADAFTALPDYPSFYRSYRMVMTAAPSLSRIGLGLVLGSPADPSGIRTARGSRDEVVALPDVLEQAAAITTIGDRPLIVMSAGSGRQEGWLSAQERLAELSTDAAHRVIPAATHESIILGADAPASTQAILDVLAAVRDESAVR